MIKFLQVYSSNLSVSKKKIQLKLRPEINLMCRSVTNSKLKNIFPISRFSNSCCKDDLLNDKSKQTADHIFASARRQK